MTEIEALDRERIWKVSEINNMVRNLVQNHGILANIWVEGEVSNWKISQYGHAYFTLKDSDSQIRAIIWRETLRALEFVPTNGDKVHVLGSVTVWTRGGEYRIEVQRLRKAGLGEWLIQLEELKRKLAKDGLFDRPKRTLPQYPERVVIITSPDGAALRDIVRIAHSNRPLLELILIPSLVQGDQAPGSLVKALRLLKEPKVREKLGRVDAVIIGRGGGSIEELWAFNNESVVREVADCDFPTISAVGHEPDWTLCDLAADVRAPTPSHAAHMIAPSQNEQRDQVRRLTDRLERSVSLYLSRCRTSLDRLVTRPCLSHPLSLLSSSRQSLDTVAFRLQTRIVQLYGRLSHTWSDLRHRLQGQKPSVRLERLKDQVCHLFFRISQRVAAKMPILTDRIRRLEDGLRDTTWRIVKNRRSELDSVSARLSLLDPFAILERGYSVIRDAVSGRLVTRAEQAAVGQEIEVILTDGKLKSQVKRVVMKNSREGRGDDL